MKYSDRQRIARIYYYAVRLQSLIDRNHITVDRLVSDEDLHWYVTTPLYNMGEHASRISQEYRQAHPDIQWNLIAGMRHHLVHDYESTNWELIAKTIFTDLPVLIKQLEHLGAGDDASVNKDA